MAAVNGEASLCFGRSVEGERLFDSMPPLDALRYQAAFESRAPFSLVRLVLENYYGYRSAAAVFQRIMSRRFAIVWLFRTAKESEDFCSAFNKEPNTPDRYVMAQFISILTSVPAELLDEGTRYGLIDLKSATRRCVNDIRDRCIKVDCKIDVTENNDMSVRKCSPAAIPLGCFMQMLSGMLLCLNEISQSRIIEVRMCAYGDAFEIRAITDALRLGINARDIDSLAAELPSCSSYLALAEFAAGVCGCSLYLRRSDDSETVTLVLDLSENEMGTVDFKSRDQFAYYSETFSAVMYQVSRLVTPRREEAPEEE